MAVERITGGNAPKDLADPTTFPIIWDETMDVLETKGWIDTQEFTSGSGNWTKPAGAKVVHVWCFGGGGGGGSGRKGAAGTDRYGGGGGQAGGVSYQMLDADDLGVTEPYAVGTGGTGGAAVTASDTNGNFGVAGGGSTFGTSLCGANGGSRGEGGTAVAGVAAATQPRGSFTVGSGAVGTITSSIPVGGYGHAGGGGGGGGIDAANNPRGGGVGGQSPGLNGGTALGGAGNSVTKGTGGGSGGGGSYGYNYLGFGVCVPGGAGGAPGGGGGGGGAGINSVGDSGAGGSGGSGRVIVITVG